MLNFLVIPHVQNKSNRACNFYVILLLNASKGSFFPRYLYITTAGVKCCVAAVKRCPVFHSSVVIFSWFSGPLNLAFLSVGNWVPLKPVLGASGMLHFFIIPHVQTQWKRVCNVILLPSDHFSLQIFIYQNVGWIAWLRNRISFSLKVLEDWENQDGVQDGLQNF
jgi:hypothetical protein